MPRYLRNRKTGVILPWNEYRVSHPDLYEWEGDPLNPDPDPVAKTPPSKPVKRHRVIQKKRAVKKDTEQQTAKESEGLLKGLLGD